MAEDVMFPETYAEWLKRTMHERGFTQADLARAVGVTRAAVSTWVMGRFVPRDNLRPVIEQALQDRYLSDLRDSQQAAKVAAQLVLVRRRLAEAAEMLADISRLLGFED